MKFSATVTLQYDTPFSPFSHEQWQDGLDWMKKSNLDGAELCISNYKDIDPYKIKEELDMRGLGCSTLSTGQARGLEGLSLIGVSFFITDKNKAKSQRLNSLSSNCINSFSAYIQNSSFTKKCPEFRCKKSPWCIKNTRGIFNLYKFRIFSTQIPV